MGKREKLPRASIRVSFQSPAPPDFASSLSPFGCVLLGGRIYVCIPGDSGKLGEDQGKFISEETKN